MTILALKIISIMVDSIPRSLRLNLGAALGSCVYYLIPFRKKVIRANLKLAFGDQFSYQQSEDLIRRNYRHYGKVLLETIAAMNWSTKQYKDKIVVTGFDQHVKPLLDQGKGGFLFTAHLGNWEVLIGAGGAYLPVDIVVKRAQVKWIEHILLWYRSRMGVGVLPETGTAREILRSISKGRFVAFVIDQFMGPPIGLPVCFFGKQAGTAAALALMTDRRDYPIVPVFSKRDAQGRLHMEFLKPMHFEDLSEDKAVRMGQKTQAFNDVIQAQVEKRPDQWLWLHRRWKPFKGQPRWKPKVAAAMGSLLWLLVACSSPQPAASTPTGIEIPPDKKVQIPEFQTEQEALQALEEKQRLIEEERKRREMELLKPKAEKTPPKEEPKTAKIEKKPPPPPLLPEKKRFEVIPLGDLPFEVGERLEVSLSWLALPAGTAVMEVRPSEPFKGRKTLHLWGNVLSSKLVDTIYHVDNTIESFVDAVGLVPYKYLLHMVETHQLKETRVNFDHTSKQAFFWSKRISEKWGNEVVDRVDPFVPQNRDMWTALYYARTFEFEKGKVVSFGVYENGKNWKVQLTPIKRELLTAKPGVFQCWKIAVTVKLENQLKQIGDINIWLSDDSKRYLVKFEAKIKIGSMIGNLVKIRERR